MPPDQTPTTIYFVRHGQATRFADEPDAGLTALGTRQARATGHLLSTRAVEAVFTSDARRALETAALIGAQCACPPVVDRRLRERAEFSPHAELSVSEFVAMWEHANVARTWQPPVGDSAAACGVRMAAFVTACHARFPGQNMVAVSHGGAIADLLSHLFTPAALTAANPDLAAAPYDGAVLRECSLTIIRTDDAHTNLVGAALGDHLP